MPTGCLSSSLDALRVANTVAHGIHGRRRAGTGETFWQFRQFQASDPAAVIDWRRSASSDNLYVREREWEAAHTFWLWPDISPSMAFRSHLAPITKRDRALVLTLAVAELLVRAGERIALLGLTPPMASRKATSRIAESLAAHESDAAAADEPAAAGASFAASRAPCCSATSSIRRRRSPPASTRWRRAASRGHLIQVLDPAEETLAYEGRMEFRSPEGQRALGRRPRRDPARRLPEEARRASRQHRGGRASHRLVVPRAPHGPAGCRAAADPDHAPAGHGRRLSLEARDAGWTAHRGRRVMTLGPIAFLSPWLLAGLIALPVIWWLLRTIPPRPRRLEFPPTRILVGIENREKTPAQTPWWLTLIRMLAAALVILALAEPVLNPNSEKALSGSGPVVLVVDNGWVGAAQWGARTFMIERLIAEAEGRSRPVLIVPTANASEGAEPQGRGPGCSALDRRGRAAAAVRARPHGRAAGNDATRSRVPPTPSSCGSPTASTTTARRASLPTGSPRSPAASCRSWTCGRARRRSAPLPAWRQGGRLDAQVLRAEGGRRDRHAACHVGARPAPRRGAVHARRRRHARARHLRHAARAQEPGDPRRDRRRALGRRRPPARCPLAVAPRRPRLGRLARAGAAAAGPALLHRAGAAAVLGDRQERRLQPLDRHRAPSSSATSRR